MSFDNNPYKNMSVHIDDVSAITLHCENCGWDSNNHDTNDVFRSWNHIGELYSRWVTHLIQSHNLRKEDVKHRSDY